MITGRQIRAARGLLRWRVEDLAQRSNLTREAVTRIEEDAVQPRESSLARLLEAFEKEGVEFLDQSGVRIKDDRVREITGKDCYAKLLDEIYYALEKGEEFLIAWADEALSTPAVHETYRRIVKKGIQYRKLIRDGNTCIHGPLDWYRYIPPEYYQYAVAVFFKDKSVYVTEDVRKVIIIRDSSLATANKNFFELVWVSAKTPKETTIKDRYS